MPKAQKRLTLAARYSPENDVTLVTGNCLLLLKQIPDRSARLVVTSPPYNLNKSYENQQSLDEYLKLQRSVPAPYGALLPHLRGAKTALPRFWGAPSRGKTGKLPRGTARETGEDLSKDWAV